MVNNRYTHFLTLLGFRGSVLFWGTLMVVFDQNTEILFDAD
jgi:hypothetical protein